MFTIVSNYYSAVILYRRPEATRLSNLTVSVNIRHYMRFFNFFVKDDERIGAL